MFIVIFALSVISMCYSSVRFMQQQRKLMIIKKSCQRIINLLGLMVNNICFGILISVDVLIQII